MSLRLKLLAVSLLTLVIPWAGCQYVQEMENALKLGVEQSLQGSARTIGAALNDRPDLLYGGPTLPTASAGRTIHAYRIGGVPRLDGFKDDWGLPVDAAGIQLSDQVTVWAGARGRYIHLFVAVDDPTPTYDVPGRVGDHVIIIPEDARSLRFSTAAPGALGAYHLEARQSEDRVLAYWREQPSGYNLEIQAPIELLGNRLGLEVVSASTGNPSSAVSTLTNERPGALVFGSSELDRVIAEFVQSGLRIRVLDREQFILTSQGTLSTEGLEESRGGFLSRLYGWLLTPKERPFPPGYVSTGWLVTDETSGTLETGDSSVGWYQREDQPGSVVLVTEPLSRDGMLFGMLVLEQTSDKTLTLTNRALTRLMNLTVIATLIAAVGLVGYATLLSLRVGRLADAAEHAMGPKGELQRSVPGTRAKDELGNLARSFENLLGRLGDYNDYLKTLAGKLSHELRTPLAVITSSIENLEHETDENQRGVYVDRLKAGANRIDGLITSMGEATRLEQAIKDTDPVLYNLGSVVDALVNGYAHAYADRRFTFEDKGGGAQVMGSPDLLAQMLDKLVDNARSFSPQGSSIPITLARQDGDLYLSVANQGPPLPPRLEDRLFDSLVSVRSGKDAGPHLGLGLHIVRLISEFHQGEASARNTDGGVVFSVRIPISQAS